MNIELEITGDGSHTLFVPSINEHYHSTYGAITETMHVYIDAGLRACLKSTVNILEIGFGTGLNAFLSLLDAEKTARAVFYTSVERYPLPADKVKKLNYASLIQPSATNLFNKLHDSEWETAVKITPHFTLQKRKIDFSKSDEIAFNSDFDVIFFDAFAPEKQPEMWTQTIFDSIFALCNPHAIITTYCAKGIVRRMLQSAGFTVERLPGPPGKREMLRGRKESTFFP